MISDCVPSPTNYPALSLDDGRSRVGHGKLAIQHPSGSASFVIVRRDVGVTQLSLMPTQVLIEDLGPGYRVMNPIPVDIEQLDGSYIASFGAASAYASGETWNEAVAALRYFVADLLDLLQSHKPEALGPGPKRQLAVLRSHLVTK